METVMKNLPTIIEGLSYVVTGASVITLTIPKAVKTQKVLKRAVDVLNFLALNFGNNKNKE